MPRSAARFEENFPGSDLGGDDWEFIRAIEAYQRKHRRRYPSWREVLVVLRGLGYRKVAEVGALPTPPGTEATSQAR